MTQRLTQQFIFIMKKLLLFFLLLFLPAFVACEELPLPEHFTAPYKDITNHVRLGSAVELELFLDKAGYSLPKTHKSRTVPQIFITNLPPDLNKLAVPNKTALFIRSLLTSVLKVNSDILTVRTEIEQLAMKDKREDSLTTGEQLWLQEIATSFHTDPTDYRDLLSRIDILPVGLVLAQAIDESGWGTSHFAIAGNALYGQHLSKESAGTFITTPDGQVRVASFDNLYHSTASYIHNLNTTKAYQKLRNDRAEIRLKHGEVTGNHLADSLLSYSERGQHYVDTLKWLIKHYNLDNFNSATFNKSEQPTLISLEH